LNPQFIDGLVQQNGSWESALLQKTSELEAHFAKPFQSFVELI